MLIREPTRSDETLKGPPRLIVGSSDRLDSLPAQVAQESLEVHLRVSALLRPTEVRRVALREPLEILQTLREVLGSDDVVRSLNRTVFCHVDPPEKSGELFGRKPTQTFGVHWDVSDQPAQ
jgi:hypothetical protein